MQPTHHLAQINLAHLKAPMDSALLKGFVDKLDEINALADASPGFVWRFLETAAQPSQAVLKDPLVIFNMSVWQDMQSLHSYVYKTAHAQVFAARAQWFHEWAGHLSASHMALWWVPAGHIPTAEEGLERLRRLLAQGPTAQAFTFKRAFSATGEALA